MRNTSLFFLLLFVTLGVHAQLNSKSGYVITNANDTIFGEIDYLSDTRNAYGCEFREKGQDAFRHYGIDEILGYRFTDNGAYYVRRTFPIDGAEKTFFAEYLLQGGVSLYYHSEGSGEYYILVGEDGRVVVLKDDNLSVSDARIDYGKKVRERSVTMSEVSHIFSKSVPMYQELWYMEFSPKNMTHLVRRYNENYCTADGECVEFLYNAKGRKVFSAHPFVTAGLDFRSTDIDGDVSKHDVTAVQMMIGCEFGLPQYTKKVCMRVAGTVGAWSYPQALVHVSKSSSKVISVALLLGISYRFLPDHSVCPYVLADGWVLGKEFISKMKYARVYEGNAVYESEDTSNRNSTGFRIGAGVDIKKHLRVEVAYRQSNLDILSQKGPSLNVGLRF